MFDIGFLEILVIAVISLIVMGPERLPQALKTFALWFGRIKQQFRSVRAELEDEIGIDEVRRQLHNENILKNLEDTKSDIKNAMDISDTNHSSNEPSENNVHSNNPTTPDDNNK